MPRTSPSVTRVLLRGLASRCPACGVGRVFVRGVESARSCDVCLWRIERCFGHWVGGNEINALVTFTAGIAAFIASAFVFGLGPVSVWIATAFTAVVGVAAYRPSRGLFYAIDFLLDPVADPYPSAAPGPPRAGDDDDGDGPHLPDFVPPPLPRPPRPSAPPPSPVPPTSPPPDSSESFIPPPSAPYPPPATVSP